MVPVGGGSLPSGWEEFFDDNRGKPYFYHEATNTTQWTRPADSPAASAAPPPAAAADSFVPSPLPMVVATPAGDPNEIWEDFLDENTGIEKSLFVFHTKKHKCL